jgi:UDP-N-acetylmuramate--alanine ligase
MDIYSAGESVIPGADGRSLCRAIRLRGQVDPIFVEHWEALPNLLASIVCEGDVILTMGAGNVGQIATQLPQLFLQALEG